MIHVMTSPNFLRHFSRHSRHRRSPTNRPAAPLEMPWIQRPSRQLDAGAAGRLEHEITMEDGLLWFNHEKWWFKMMFNNEKWWLNMMFNNEKWWFTMVLWDDVMWCIGIYVHYSYFIVTIMILSVIVIFFVIINQPLSQSSGWWFGTWIFFFHILGLSSSQLTFIYFQRGWNHQPVSYMGSISYDSGHIFY